MSGGSILLGEVAAHADHLDVACNRCDRAGRLRIDKLIADHGAAMPIPALRRIVAADCPKWAASRVVTDLCGLHFPQLPALFLPSGR